VPSVPKNEIGIFISRNLSDILFITYNLINICFIGFHSLFTVSYSDDFGEIIQFYLDTNEQTVLSELHLWHAILKKKKKYPKNSLEALR